jgi:hypothetical protein
MITYVSAPSTDKFGSSEKQSYKNNTIAPEEEELCMCAKWNIN